MRKIVAFAASAAAFVASPAVASVGGIVDGSFETQGFAEISNGSSYCYANGSCNVNTPWSASGNAGIMDSNSAWGNVAAQDGTYYGFIQTTGSLSQTFTASSTGDFLLNFFAAGRPSYAGIAGGDQTFNVLLNGTNIFTGSTSSGSAWTGLSSNLFSLVAGNSYTLIFQGTDTNPANNGDNTAFIDNVSLQSSTGAVPEPATWAMMLLGFGAIGFAMRRQRSQALLQVA